MAALTRRRHEPRWAPPAIRWDDAHHLVVTARLQQGAALHPWWPAPLDGLLASAARTQRLGLNRGAVDHHVEPIPLARWTGTAGLNNRWVYAATCARPVGVVDEEVHWWHSRLDLDEAARMCGPLPVVREMGRWRSWRMPLPVVVCAELQWHAAGDPAEVRRLLDQLVQIGKARGQGEGRVLRWTVDDHGPADPDADELRWTAEGTVARPFPLRAARWLGVPDDVDVVAGVYRPPYWRGLHDPDGSGRHAWQDVIAPWVTRPAEVDDAAA